MSDETPNPAPIANPFALLSAAAAVPPAPPAAPVAPAAPAKILSDGGSTAYYNIPDGAAELNDLIEHKEMGFALGNIFKACYRLGEKAGADLEYDIQKIIYFAKDRLLPYVQKNGRLP